MHSSPIRAAQVETLGGAAATEKATLLERYVYF